MRGLVYGVSTEGYSIAKALAIKGIDTAMVDEDKGMAISISPEVALSYANIGTLMQDEQLLRLEPESSAIASADYIFFAPIVRRLGQEAYNEVSSKLKNIAKHLKDALFIYCIPTAIGGNKEIIDIIAASARNSSRIDYCYMPIMPDGMVYILGSESSIDSVVYEVCKELNMNTSIKGMRLEAAEVAYAIKVLSITMPTVTSFEACKGISDYAILSSEKSLSELFIDDLTLTLFDIHMLANSTNDMLVRMVNNCIRSIEGYSKHLIDRIRNFLRRNEIRASKARILAAWSIDNYSMRSDRMLTLKSLLSRLKDHIDDVSKYDPNSRYYDDKRLLILTCSRRDHEMIISKHGKELKDEIVIKANPLCEIISNEGF